MALFTFFILAITATSTAAPSGLVDRVCKSTTHRAFCHALLDPFNSTNDPYTLASIAVGFTYYNATSTKGYIHSWLRSNENNVEPGTRRGMLDCEGYYKQAIEALKKMYKRDLLKGWENWRRMWRNVDWVVKWLSCVHIQTPSWKNQKFIYLAEICAAVSDLFPWPVVN